VRSLGKRGDTPYSLVAQEEVREREKGTSFIPDIVIIIFILLYMHV
jgi:hypothetical protein